VHGFQQRKKENNVSRTWQANANEPGIVTIYKKIESLYSMLRPKRECTTDVYAEKIEQRD